MVEPGRAPDRIDAARPARGGIVQHLGRHRVRIGDPRQPARRLPALHLAVMDIVFEAGRVAVGVDRPDRHAIGMLSIRYQLIKSGVTYTVRGTPGTPVISRKFPSDCLFNRYHQS